MAPGPPCSGSAPELISGLPISSGSPPCSGDGLPRGLISCRAHDVPTVPDHNFRYAVSKLIIPLYEEAFHRLPRKIDDMPDLLRLLTTGGSCIGLLDPVSNIILNTLALLPYHSSSSSSSDSSPPAAKRRRRSKRQAWADLDDAAHAFRRMAGRSCHGLADFLVVYFGCLTDQQAFRYLYRAGADLPLAAMLVQHDLYQQPHALDPHSARTQAALKSAATKAYHPEPSTLVQLMATKLYTGPDAFDLLKKKFSGDRITYLKSKHVRAIHRLLHRPYDDEYHHGLIAAAERTTTSVDVSSDGTTVTTTTTTVGPVSHRITSLRHTHDMAAKLPSCLTKAPYGGGHKKHTRCGGGDKCDYQQSLKMYLQGMIHDLYLTALSLLPTPSASLLMPSILMAGHCYGSMDPVLNIIVNSIWYNKCGCPLPESASISIKPYTDILDPLSLLRTELHSLRGLRELAKFADPQFSTAASALENLCSTKCDIVNMLSSSSSTLRNPFHEAAMAAGHPLPLQLGELHQQLLLMPVERNKLLSLMTEARTSGTVLPIHEIASILDMVSSSSSRAQTPLLVQAPKGCVKALSEISSHRSDYEEKRGSFFRSKLEHLLKEYASQHVWEPKYTLDFVFGVEESLIGPHGRSVHRRYHVNFMATCGLRLRKTLFFAEFWWQGREPKPNFCCPIPYPYASRCYYGVHNARRIVYPDRSEYILPEVSYGKVDGMLEMDCVYFSSQRYVEQSSSEEEEE